MSDDEHTYTNEENPELASLFRDLYDPAVGLWKHALAAVPKERKVRVAELEVMGQSVVMIHLPGDGRAQCVIVDGQEVVELGTSKIEATYQRVLDEFVDFGVDHMLRSDKIAKRHREGKLPYVVMVLVDERRVRLVALQDADPAKHLVLFELTGAETPAAMLN